MKLEASNGGRVSSPLQSDVGFELKSQETAWVDCSAVANPPPGVRWLLVENANQTLNASAYRLNGSRLVLSDARLLAATSARFVCEASNSINGKIKTTTLAVTIKITGARLFLSVLYFRTCSSTCTLGSVLCDMHNLY